MFRKIRIIVECLCFLALALLFVDVTGVLHRHLGFMARIQFIPALLSVNLVVVAVLLLLTFIFGRVYCSVICPLAAVQDIANRAGGLGKKGKHRFRFRKENKWLRFGFLAAFIALMVAGLSSIASLIEPYSAFGRMAENILAPLYRGMNNLFASVAENSGSYDFSRKDVWIKSLPTFVIACATLILLFVLSFKGGRTWCSNVCPVGSILSLVSRFAIFRPVIDTAKCNGCGSCARKCRASCIDPEAHKVDMSRCVVCMDCIGNCRQGAISYRPFFAAKSSSGDTAALRGNGKAAKPEAEPSAGVDVSKRNFISVAAMIASAATLEAAEKKTRAAVAGGSGRVMPTRTIQPKPAGSVSLRHFERNCTACQLCVASCPNSVLRPSSELGSLMQPQMSFELGYCRPECTKCSEVCPSGAIHRVSAPEKSSIQTGRAVWIRDNCVVLTDNVSCGNCARHCPCGAIKMVRLSEGSDLRIPSVNGVRCIGCGSCEYHCPAAPVSAIYVEGVEVQHEI